MAWQSGRCVIATECSCVVPSQFVSEQDANLVEVSSAYSLELGWVDVAVGAIPTHLIALSIQIEVEYFVGRGRIERG